MVRDAYGDDADKILKKYPLSKYKTPGAAWTATQTDDTSATRQQLFRDLSKYVNTYAYEFAESSTPQFASIWLLQQKNEAARNFPFGATHVDDLPYLWQYLGQTLPFTDDQLELSDQMISYWSSFVTRQNPNSAVTPKCPCTRLRRKHHLAEGLRHRTGLDPTPGGLLGSEPRLQ